MMENGSPNQPDWPWNEMLDALRALGGAAHNIVLGSGLFGRGLFPVDPGKPVLLQVPGGLLIPVDDFVFKGGKLRIKESADVPNAERAFLERYESTYSWGASGRSDCIAHIAALDALPPEIRQLLIADFQFGDLLQGDFSERVRNFFVRSRAIRWRDGLAIAPLIELANHDATGLRYERGTHLRLDGHVRDEVLVRYGPHDALSIFSTFGFVSREPAAFSLSIRVGFRELAVSIGRDTGEGTNRGRDRIPIVATGDGEVELSYLMIGHYNLPRLSRGTFCTLLREAGMNNPDEAFDEILRFNAIKFINLLRALEPYDGATISDLRTMARYQLEAMTYCIGSRELRPALPSAE
jgi:hypothetical protein